MLQERTGSNEVSEEEAGRPACIPTPQLPSNIFVCLADFFHLLGQCQRELVLAPVPMKHPLAKGRLLEALGSIVLLGQCARSGVGRADLGRREALRSYQ